MTVHVVPAHLGYVAELGDRRPSAIKGSYLVAVRDRQVVIVDAARFAQAGAVPDPAAVGDAILRRAAPVPPAEPGTLRVRYGDEQLTHRLGVARGSIVPHGDGWDEPLLLRDVAMTLAHPDGTTSQAVLLPRGQTAPSRAAVVLLGVLALVASREQRAEALYHGLLAPHGVTTVVPGSGAPRNLVVRSTVPLAASTCVVWSTPQRVWAFEVGPTTTGLSTTPARGRSQAVQTAAPHLLAFVDEMATARPAPAPRGMQVLDGDRWVPAPDPLDGRARVDGIAREHGGHLEVLSLREPAAASDASAVLDRVLARKGRPPSAAPRIPPAEPAAATAVHRHRIEESIEAARAFIRPWFGRIADPDASALIVDRFRMVGSTAEPRITPDLRALMRRTSLESLEQRHRGRNALVLLAVARGVDEAQEVPAATMADLLTAFLAVTNSQQREPLHWTPKVLIRHATEWVLGRRLAWTGFGVLPPGVVARPRFAELAAPAPWLWWLAPPDPGRAPVRLTARELVELLALLRPTRAFRHQANQQEATEQVPFPARFRSVYAFPDADGLDDETLGELSESLWNSSLDPDGAARRTQGIELPETYRALLDELFDPMGAPGGLDQVLAIRADVADEARVLVFNLSADRRLRFSIGQDNGGVLERRAVEEPGATAYGTPPIPLRGEQALRVDGVELALDVPPIPMAPPAGEQHYSIAQALFRGRRTQLDMLRRPLLERGRRTSSLIIGNRRAGKTTLAWRVTEEPGVRGNVFLDLASFRWDGLPGWNRRVLSELRVLASTRLGLQLELEPDADLVEAITAFDRQVGEGPPVVLILDELDVLLTLDRGTDARRLAGRLGSLAPANLVLIGTVQRFHRSTPEFKSWQIIDCPVDLEWGDGVTYFMPALAGGLPGPRVEQSDRAALIPQVFRTEVVGSIGYRPYFWGQLRVRLDSLVRYDETRSRIVGPEDTRRACDDILLVDGHLAAPLDAAPGLTQDEAQRRDLFSAAERRVLLQLARLAGSKEGISRVAAVRVGGTAAVDSLLDRGYLSPFSNDEQLRTAVPVYHRFLRSRAGQLQDIVEAESRDLALEVDLL